MSRPSKVSVGRVNKEQGEDVIKREPTKMEEAMAEGRNLKTRGPQVGKAVKAMKKDVRSKKFPRTAFPRANQPLPPPPDKKATNVPKKTGSVILPGVPPKPSGLKFKGANTGESKDNVKAVLDIQVMESPQQESGTSSLQNAVPGINLEESLDKKYLTEHLVEKVENGTLAVNEFVVNIFVIDPHAITFLFFRRRLSLIFGNTLAHYFCKMSPLGYAITFSRSDIIQILLEKGAPVDEICRKLDDGTSWNPLGHAITTGNYDIAVLLLQNGANPDIMCHQTADGASWNSLGRTIYLIDKKIAKLLLRVGADVNTVCCKLQDGSKWTALGLTIARAVRSRNMYQFAEMVCEKGADIRIACHTTSSGMELKPIEYIVSKKCFSVIPYLSSHLEFREHLGNLREVDFSDQNAEFLPLWMSHLSDNVLLHLEGNPLNFIPETVKSGGLKSLLQYLRDISASGGKTQWKKAKVMVLGEEGVGKTHIYHQIRNLAYEDLSTNGIDINEFELNGIELRWFDFGGQEVFYPTHQFFLTPQCIYLVVFRLDDPGYLDRVSYWLQNVKTFSQGKNPAKVLIVATHADVVKSKQTSNVWSDLEPLMREAGNVVGYLEVSCKTGKGFDSLLNGIKQAMEEAKLGVLEIPYYYLDVQVLIFHRRAKTPKLSFDEFQSRFPKLSEYQLYNALRFLSNMGQCYFNKGLNIVVLNLQWLSDMFKSLITFQNKWVKDGIIWREELVHVWEENEIDENMKILESFNIAFLKREEGKWVIPCMLKEDGEELDVTRGEMRFERKFKLEIVPKGVMGRLSVRIQSNPSVIVSKMWRNGIVVKSDVEEGMIVIKGSDIWIKCITFDKSKHGLVQKLSEECLALLRSDRSARPYFEQIILCPHCFKKELKYEDGIEMVMSNEQYFECGNESVEVRLLGPDVTFSFVKVFEKEEVQVKEKFASGEFGDIYKAIMKDTTVVVKELKIMAGFDEFQKEVSVMSTLKHPNIVELFGIMLNPLRMVMEICEGEDLHTAIQQGQIVGLEEKIALDIAKGMWFLHSHAPPIVHRDLKSQNIFLTKHMTAKVADFGLSTFASERMNAAVGTMMTMAPELQRGDLYTESCDLYSYAVVVFETYRGPNPEINLFAELFEKGTREREVFDKMVSENLRPSIPSNTPNWMCKLITLMWHNDPSERPSFEECIHVIASKGEFKICGKKKDNRQSEIVRAVIEEGEGSPMYIQHHNRIVWTGWSNGILRSFLAKDLKELKSEKMQDGCLNSICCLQDSVLCGGKGGVIRRYRNQERKIDGDNVGTLKKIKGSPKIHFFGKRRESKSDILTTVLEEETDDLFGMLRLNSFVLCCFCSGLLKLWSEENGVVSSHHIKQRINCINVVDQFAIIGTSSDLLKVEMLKDRNLSVKMLKRNIFDASLCGVAYLGHSELVCCSWKGDICVLNLKDMKVLESRKIDMQIHCMNVVTVYSEQNIWIGTENEIHIFERKKGFMRKLQMPKAGKVVGMEIVGIDTVWISIEIEDARKGALYEWQFF